MSAAVCLCCWVMCSSRHRAELVVDALDMADALGRLEPGCGIHSDRGPEYTSGQLRDRIGELGHRQSMGRTGSCRLFGAFLTGRASQRGCYCVLSSAGGACFVRYVPFFCYVVVEGCAV
ncbi:DDE-type integrase/transposase/recombinase [Streptomyces sp. NPDC001774]